MATIRKRGKKWQAQVRCKEQTASRTFSQRSDAVSWARKAELQAERGELGLEQNNSSSSNATTFADVITRYRDEITVEKRSTDSERYAINNFLRTKLATVKLTMLTPADISKHRDARLKVVKASTVVRELGWLQHAIEIATQDWQYDLPDGNPVKKVRRPRIDNRRERRLQSGEWEKLCSAARESRQALLEPLLKLALETGMRRGELLSMRWCDFDQDRCTVTLQRTKNGHPRTVPLTLSARAILMQLQQCTSEAAKPCDSDRIIPMTGNAVRLGFERLRRKAGVQNITFHDLRHEAVSRFVERGLSLAQVQMISGHRDLRMLMRYTHLAVDDIVHALHDKKMQCTTMTH